MKKIHIFGLGIIACILLGAGVYFFLQKTAQTPLSEESLAEIQNLESTQSGAASIARAMSLEKQKQLKEISEIYSVQANAHLDAIVILFQKYKSDFSLTDAEKVQNMLSENPSETSLGSQIFETTGIKILKNDIKELISGQQSLQEEKGLEQERLNLLKEEHEKEVLAGSQKLLEMALKESVETFSDSGSLKNPEKMIQSIVQSTTQTQNIFDGKVFNTHEKQILFLEKELQKYIFGTSLSETQKQELQEHILETIRELEVLLPENETSSLWNRFSQLAFVQVWDFFIPESYASDTQNLSPSQRALLLQKTQVQINLLLQKSIDTEISLNNKSITAVEYNTIINQNLIAIEELLIFQESLENDSSVISLDDIQRFDLGSYVDDSAQIVNLEPIAYIESKKGHAMVQNLNGSVKLAQKDMLLYPGYTIETLQNAEVTLVFIDESLLRLEAESKVSLKNSSENLAVEVNKGSIWSRVLKPLLSGEVFTIDTGDVSLAVAGTSVYVTASGSTKQVFVVDSYSPGENASVIATQKSNSSTQQVSSGKRIDIATNGTLQVGNQNKASLLQAKNQLGEHIAEDLNYLSLTLDDRKRGFYNSPLAAKNNGQNFLGKLEGELEVSLPTAVDRDYIIKNKNELSGISIHTGSIYHIIKQDELITHIKNSSNAPALKLQKISAVQNLDFQTIETELGNKRALESIFNYNIADDILEESSMNPSSLTDLFLDFDIQERERISSILQESKNKLNINDGSSVVSRDITLPTSMTHSGETISIVWESSLPSTLSSTGIVQNEEITQDVKIILTATLTLGNLSTGKDFPVIVTPRQLTEREKLEKAGTILDRYLDTVGKRFVSQIVYMSGSQIISPDFTQNNGIIPKVTWSGSIYVNLDGTTNRPKFSESVDPLDPFNPYISTNVKAELIHPAFPDISLTKTYTVQIKKKDETPEEILARIASTAWDTILAGNVTGNPEYFSKNTPLLPLSITPVSLSYKVSGSGALSGNILSLQQSANTGSLTLTPLLTIVHDGITYTGSLEPSSKVIKVPLSPEALANQTLSGARLAIDTYFKTASNKNIPKEKNGLNMRNILNTALSPDINSQIVLLWSNNYGQRMSSGGLISSPSFDTGNVTLTGSLTLSLPGATITAAPISNLNLTFKKLDESPDEKLNRLADTFWTDFSVTGITGTQITGTTISLTPTYNKTLGIVGELSTQASVSYTKTGSGTLTGTNLSVSPGVTVQSITLIPKLTIGTSHRTLSSRTFTVPISSAAIAKASIDRAKDDFEDYFDSRQEIAVSSMPHPAVGAGVEIKWMSGGSFVSQSGDVTRPGVNATDRDITLSAVLSHPDTSYTQTASDLFVKIKKLPCNAPNIRIPDTDEGVCYELLASAEYEDNLKLQKVGGGSISPNTNLSGQPVGGGLTVSGAGKYLKYESLFTNLGILSTDDWAIELEVNSNDLGRLDGYYSLINLPAVVKLYSMRSNTYVADYGFGIYKNTTVYNFIGKSFGTGYKNLFLIKEGNKYKVNLNGLIGEITNSQSSSDIYIGSNSVSSEQWGGNIRYFKIYKKKSN